LPFQPAALNLPQTSTDRGHLASTRPFPELDSLFTTPHIEEAFMKVGTIEAEQPNEGCLVKMPAGIDARAMLDKAQRLASNYAVILGIDGKVLGSGTLVTAKGIPGILTAHHVAIVPYLREGGEFSLCIRDDVIHRLNVRTSQFNHVVVGDSKKNRFEHTGPDLSFLMITDPELLSTLKARKSFYPLIKRADTAKYPEDKLRKMAWAISGSPEEFAQELGMYHGEKLTKVSDFHVRAELRSLKQTKGFDYLRFEVFSGVHGCPKVYGGVSGGGIWLLTMQKMRNGENEFAPMLQGVVFYESRPYQNETKRMLIGHGPDSIYGCLIPEL
jgi:hypothetical protein